MTHRMLRIEDMEEEEGSALRTVVLFQLLSNHKVTIVEEAED